MKLSEFRTWFDGLLVGFTGAPGSEVVAEIGKRLAQVDDDSVPAPRPPKTPLAEHKGGMQVVQASNGPVLIVDGLREFGVFYDMPNDAYVVLQLTGPGMPSVSGSASNSMGS
jgi:hypothetical protein